MNDFDYDVMQKKRIARMAKYRKGGSKSKKCPMSTDYMTRKQWEERCGEVYTYTMNEPKSWGQFKELPTNIQKEYLTHLVQNYQCQRHQSGDDVWRSASDGTPSYRNQSARPYFQGG